MADSLDIKYLTSVDGKPVGVDVAERDSDGNIIKNTYINKDGSNSLTNSLNLNSNKIINLKDPENDTDAATKKYVDTSTSSKADLIDGLVPASQLPSYVDDVIDFQYSYSGSTWYASCAGIKIKVGQLCYNSATAEYVPGGTSGAFYHAFAEKIAEPETTWLDNPTTYKDQIIACLKAIAPESGKIYVGTSDSKTFRWSGTNLVEISKSIGLNSDRSSGTTSTAYQSTFGAQNYQDILALQQVAAYNYVGAANSASNAATSNGSTCLKLYENETQRSQFYISGSGGTLVSSDSSGNIKIYSTDNPGYSFYFSSTRSQFDEHYDISGTWSITLYFADGTYSVYSVGVEGVLSKANVVAAKITANLTTSTGYYGLLTKTSSGYVFSTSGIKSAYEATPKFPGDSSSEFMLMSPFKISLVYEYNVS